jgi:hypothetical protein
MALIAPAYVNVNPSFTDPQTIMPFFQASGAFDMLPDGEPQVRLGEGDLVYYINRIDLRTKVGAGQSATNLLPSSDIIFSQVQTASYLVQSRAEYNHHDIAAAARRGIALPEAQRMAAWQGFASLTRIALIFGFNPAGGEGIFNAIGATAYSMPPDQFNNTTALTYDNGQFAFNIAQQVAAIKTRTYQLGSGRDFVLVGPQRILSLFEYNVVQLTSYQRIGAGTDSSKGTVNAILMANGDRFIWAYDDTLIGQGAGGADALLLVMPIVEPPTRDSWDTSVFSSLKPSKPDCTAQLCDMAAPREIPVPIAGGAIDVLYEQRITSGFGIRPEAITVISFTY